jgi:hypothetical protein
MTKIMIFIIFTFPLLTVAGNQFLSVEVISIDRVQTQHIHVDRVIACMDANVIVPPL